MLAGRLTRYLDDLRNRHPLPAMLVLWDGTEVNLGDEARVTIRLRDRTALTTLMQPSLESLGNAYVEGRIDVEGPIAEVIRVAADLADQGGTSSALGALPDWARRHTRRSDRKAISYHYDVSNDFYAQFLDPSMVYSCAYFKTPQMSLEEAQQAKLEHVCRKLRIEPGMRLLDIGCGWGAMAIHAARRHGARVLGITLSERQHELALERVARAGLTDQIEIRLQDYRDLPGDESFDRVSSIGMFEHVGLKHLLDYFKRIHALLKPGGIALNHGICSADADSRSVGRGGGEFIGRYVFPDGELPHVSLAIAELSRAGLEMVDAESLRRHYGRTLWHWSERFEARLDALRAIAGEERTRIWRTYLAGCAWAFDQGWVNIYQLLAAKPLATARALEISQPMTRDYMYVPESAND